MGVGTCIALHPKVLVVEVYKLAAIEGKNPESRLRMCEDERALLSSGVSNFVVCVSMLELSLVGCSTSPFIATRGGGPFTCVNLVIYSSWYAGESWRRHCGDWPPRPCGIGSGVVISVGGVVEPCLDRAHRIRGSVLCPATGEQ